MDESIYVARHAAHSAPLYTCVHRISCASILQLCVCVCVCVCLCMCVCTDARPTPQTTYTHTQELSTKKHRCIQEHGHLHRAQQHTVRRRAEARCPRERLPCCEISPYPTETRNRFFFGCLSQTFAHSWRMVWAVGGMVASARRALLRRSRARIRRKIRTVRYTKRVNRDLLVQHLFLNLEDVGVFAGTQPHLVTNLGVGARLHEQLYQAVPRLHRGDKQRRGRMLQRRHWVSRTCCQPGF